MAVETGKLRQGVGGGCRKLRRPRHARSQEGAFYKRASKLRCRIATSSRKLIKVTSCDLEFSRRNVLVKPVLIPIDVIQNRILLIRGRRVIMDYDLAALYGVTTARLNEQVRRNIERFPADFIFGSTTRSSLL